MERFECPDQRQADAEGNARNRQQRDESEIRIGAIVEQAVERALDKAMLRYFESIGIDSTDAKARAAVRKDLEWVRTRREQGEDDSKTWRSKVIGALTLAVMAIMGGGLTTYLVAALHGTGAHP